VTLRNAAASLACAVALAACSSASLVPPQAGRAAQSGVAGAERVVGSVHLKRCFDERDYYCATLRRPLDPAGEVPGTIEIAFAWLPHSDARRRATGTIVAVEGGPGYPSIGSRALYRGLYAPLLATRDLLVVDNRGTGASDVIDCPLIQRAPLMKLHQVAACGAQLGKQSDLFGTGIAADDMAAVIRALGIARVDLYGDSYGTFFVQAFARRHPRSVHSIVLDGAYPVTGASPWYPSTGRQIRDAFDLVCRRSDVCSTLPGSSQARIAHLVAVLRQGNAPKLTPSDLAFVMDSAGLDLLAYRDLDAAARAMLEGGDLIPLTRLVREAYAYDEGAGSAAKRYSQGLFVAASCADNPQAYDMRLEPTARERQWQEAIARKESENPDLYAPFSIGEYLGIPPDYAYLPLCLPWPVPSRLHPPGEPVPPGTRFPDVPVLVLTGDLDTITTPEEGDAATRLFARAHHLIVANTGHVSALDDYKGCASSIVQRFTESGQIDGGCASRVAALHLVPSFARTLGGVIPATASAGNHGTDADLRAAAAATLAAADVLARAYEFTLTSGSGLRGGTFTAATQDSVTSATLTGIAWTRDLFVSGSAQSGARSMQASAHLTLQGAAAGTIDAKWSTTGSRATATIGGTIDGRDVRATMPAP
jgi:pimeloyl-ACP methyl ester carboxylesterase